MWPLGQMPPLPYIVALLRLSLRVVRSLRPRPGIILAIIRGKDSTISVKAQKRFIRNRREPIRPTPGTSTKDERWKLTFAGAIAGRRDE